MGAVETMEDFFEKLNSGDREGAVALMDEKTEMRVHVGDSVQMLRGVERVGCNAEFWGTIIAARQHAPGDDAAIAK